jgi:hypothetical protein
MAKQLKRGDVVRRIGRDTDYLIRECEYTVSAVNSDGTKVQIKGKGNAWLRTSGFALIEPPMKDGGSVVTTKDTVIALKTHRGVYEGTEYGIYRVEPCGTKIIPAGLGCTKFRLSDFKVVGAKPETEEPFMVGDIVVRNSSNVIYGSAVTPGTLCEVMEVKYEGRNLRVRKAGAKKGIGLLAEKFDRASISAAAKFRQEDGEPYHSAGNGEWKWEFKVGDRVVSLQGGGGLYLTEGEVYTVKSIDKETGEKITLDEITKCHSYPSSYFKHADKTGTTVVSTGAQPSSPDTAARLTVKQPTLVADEGITFGIGDTVTVTDEDGTFIGEVVFIADGKTKWDVTGTTYGKDEFIIKGDFDGCVTGHWWVGLEAKVVYGSHPKTPPPKVPSRLKYVHPKMGDHIMAAGRKGVVVALNTDNWMDKKHALGHIIKLTDGKGSGISPGHYWISPDQRWELLDPVKTGPAYFKVNQCIVRRSDYEPDTLIKGTVCKVTKVNDNGDFEIDHNKLGHGYWYWNDGKALEQWQTTSYSPTGDYPFPIGSEVMKKSIPCAGVKIGERHVVEGYRMGQGQCRGLHLRGVGGSFTIETFEPFRPKPKPKPTAFIKSEPEPEPEPKFKVGDIVVRNSYNVSSIKVGTSFVVKGIRTSGNVDLRRYDGRSVVLEPMKLRLADRQERCNYHDGIC